MYPGQAVIVGQRDDGHPGLGAYGAERPLAGRLLEAGGQQAVAIADLARGQQPGALSDRLENREQSRENLIR